LSAGSSSGTPWQCRAPALSFPFGGLRRAIRQGCRPLRIEAHARHFTFSWRNIRHSVANLQAKMPSNRRYFPAHKGNVGARAESIC